MSNYPLAKDLHAKDLIKFDESTLFFNMDSLIPSIPMAEPNGKCQPTHDYMWFEHSHIVAEIVRTDYGVLLSKWRDRAFIADSVALFPEFVPIIHESYPDAYTSNVMRAYIDRLREISEIALDHKYVMGYCAGVVFTSQGLINTSKKALKIGDEMFDTGALNPSYSILPAKYNGFTEQTLSNALNVLNMAYNGVIEFKPDTYDKAIGEGSSR